MHHHVHVVTGSAGCKEGRDPFIKKTPPWSAFHASVIFFWKSPKNFFSWIIFFRRNMARREWKRTIEHIYILSRCRTIAMALSLINFMWSKITMMRMKVPTIFKYEPIKEQSDNNRRLGHWNQGNWKTEAQNRCHLLFLSRVARILSYFVFKMAKAV